MRGKGERRMAFPERPDAERGRFRVGLEVERPRRPSEAGLLLWLGLAFLSPWRPVAGQTQWNILVHGSSISYLDSQVKTAGYTGGFYGTFGAHWKHFLEAGVARTRIEHRSGYALQQHDLTIAYSHFWARGSGRVGAHLVLNNDPTGTDGGVVWFGGASAYRVGVWSAGAEAALSTYPDYGGGLTVVQVAPSAGFTAGLSPPQTYFSGVIRGYYIGLSDDVGLDGRSFLSAEASLSLTSGRFSVSGFGWGGEQAFAVRQGGFLLFNVAERHTGGYGGGVRWVLSPNSAASAGLYLERFKDMGMASRAWARTIVVSVGFTL